MTVENEYVEEDERREWVKKRCGRKKEGPKESLHSECKNLRTLRNTFSTNFCREPVPW